MASHLCNHSSCFLSALKGLSHGLQYGAKVRFVHAIVIMILYGRGDFQKRLVTILRLTKEHTFRLGAFVFLYKLLQCGLAYLRGKRTPFNSLVAGGLAGGLLFSKHTCVTTQIVLYLFSRVISGGLILVYNRQNVITLPKVSSWSFPVMSTLCWAMVMYLYTKDQNTLQPSLQSSMNYLYTQSDTWTHWTDFIPFYDSIFRKETRDPDQKPRVMQNNR